jgi:hypothetical protein
VGQAWAQGRQGQSAQPVGSPTTGDREEGSGGAVGEIARSSRQRQVRANMGIGFIIMQIGNTDLDRICRDAIVPALSACGLDPKRVDKHNEGGLLKNEIIDFIEKAEIIIADLTNERPNCYLEVGYGMGIDKFRNLILTAREDHNQDSPTHRPGGPKVHFDLHGYDVLFWRPEGIEEFRIELEKRIRRRQSILATSTSTAPSPWDREWIAEQHDIAEAGLRGIARTAYLEVAFALSKPKPTKSPQELLTAAQAAVLDTTGWPFALVLTKEDMKPRPKSFGIAAEVVGRLVPNHYDYWAIRRDGDFYSLRSFAEDGQEGAVLWFNHRINMVTEVLLYCARLYTQLGLDPLSVVNIEIRHVGLRDRVLDAVGTRRISLWAGRRASEDEASTQISIPLSKIESELVALVKEFTKPLFTLFDFFELADRVYEDIVNRFVAGEVT